MDEPRSGRRQSVGKWFAFATAGVVVNWLWLERPRPSGVEVQLLLRQILVVVAFCFLAAIVFLDLATYFFLWREPAADDSQASNGSSLHDSKKLFFWTLLSQIVAVSILRDRGTEQPNCTVCSVLVGAGIHLCRLVDRDSTSA